MMFALPAILNQVNINQPPFQDYINVDYFCLLSFFPPIDRSDLQPIPFSSFCFYSLSFLEESLSYESITQSCILSNNNNSLSDTITGNLYHDLVTHSCIYTYSTPVAQSPPPYSSGLFQQLISNFCQTILTSTPSNTFTPISIINNCTQIIYEVNIPFIIDSSTIGSCNSTNLNSLVDTRFNVTDDIITGFC